MYKLRRAIIGIVILSMFVNPWVSYANSVVNPVDFGCTPHQMIEYINSHSKYDAVKLREYDFHVDVISDAGHSITAFKSGFFQAYVINEKTKNIHTLNIAFNKEADVDKIISSANVLIETSRIMMEKIGRISEYSTIIDSIGIENISSYFTDMQTSVAYGGVTYIFSVDTASASLFVSVNDVYFAKASVDNEVNWLDARAVLEEMEKTGEISVGGKKIYDRYSDVDKTISAGSDIYFYDKLTGEHAYNRISIYYSTARAIEVENSINSLSYYFPETMSKCYRYNNCVLVLSPDVAPYMELKYAIAFFRAFQAYHLN